MATQRQSNPRAVSAPLDLLQLVPVPDEMRSAEQYDRFYHYDLPSLTRADLARELVAVQLINLAIDSEWYREREQRLAEQLAS